MAFIRKNSALSKTTSQRKNVKTVSLSKRCGVTFPVARIKRLLRTLKLSRCRRISVSAAAFLSAVLEYMTSEVLELAGGVAKSCKRKCIAPRFIMLAVASDAELAKFLPNVTFPFSGVVPSINTALLKASHRTAPKSPRSRSLLPNSPKPQPASNSYMPIVLRKTTLPGGQILEIVQGDIAELDVDAVVNPTNSTFSMSGMVGSSLMSKGGAEFAQAVQDDTRNVILASLSVHVTAAPGLKSKHVIHVNGPIWNASQANEKLHELELCVGHVLSVATSRGFTSIALPSIGSGRANFPKAIAAETIVATIKQFFTSASTLKQVNFVLFDQESIDCYIYEISRTT